MIDSNAYMNLVVSINRGEYTHLKNMYNKEELEKLEEIYMVLKNTREKTAFNIESALETRVRTHLTISVQCGVMPCVSNKIVEKIDVRLFSTIKK